MPALRNNSRYGNPLVLAAHAAALAALSAFAFRSNLELLFAGLDGVYLLTMIEQQFAWLPLAAGFFASPFQGLGDFGYPINVWLMPGYLLPHFVWGAGGEMLPAFRVGVYVVVALELFGAMLVLARTLGASRLAALAGAWLFLLLLMPWSGPSELYPFVMLAPHNATALSEICLLMAALYSLGRGTTRRDVLLVLGIAAIAAHLALTQPNSVILCLPAVVAAVIGGIAGTMGRHSGAVDRRERIVKAGGPAIAAFLLAATGFAVFFVGIYAYSVARFWPAQLENDRLTWYFVSIAFHRAANGWAGPLLFLGGVLGLLHAFHKGERRERGFAAAILAFMGLLGVGGALTVYWDFWRGPSPLYFEFYLWPLYAIYSARAALAALTWSLPRLGRAGGAIAPFMESPVALALLLPLVVALPLAAAARSGNLGARLYFPLPPAEAPMVSFLREHVALAPGKAFAGRVASMDGLNVGEPVGWLQLHFYFHAPRAGVTGNDHYHVGLWHFGIPTLLEYSSSLSPAFFRLATRFLARPGDRQLRSVLVLRKPDARLLGLLGVRFLVADAPQPAPFRRVMTQATRPEETLYLYEVPAANLGKLSPVALRKVGAFEQALDALADPRFDAGETALVFDEPGEGPLSRAAASDLSVVPGGYIVKATSAGRSLLVVPYEFSRCLRARSLDPAAAPPRLIRVDALLTGILFERSVEAEIRYFSGPFDGAGCRLRDGDDLRALLR